MTAHLPYSEPELRDILVAHKLDVARSINCVQIGKIESFDKAKNTCELSIQAKRQYADGTVLEYPLFVDCPVFTLNGGGAFLSMPIAAGDFCLVLFNDRSIDAWYQTGLPQVPGDTRVHSLSDGIALVGIQPSTSPLGLVDDKVLLDAGSNLIKLKNDNKDLKTLVGTLMDKLIALHTVPSAPSTLDIIDPQFAIDIAALKTEFNLLLG